MRMTSRAAASTVTAPGSPHAWGTAANIYRIGAEYVDSEERIARYGWIAARAVAGCWVRPYGTTTGLADDHLHVDLGYVTAVPRHRSELRAE